ncbi:uncharacterized protein DUF2313 [Ruminiclostridium sufflavum DSM 19573]|uniref:Uncharacterized protein DUF2313 n=1 Tax=Ruminiclostridium sufflavum DSM 19573 TaxID=1121337 RepID=A0A318XMR1_9FIRM|nr:putative phage tail protein [Ruminiclostridium sufflavum]PYG87212.1 uncharacterized protein DUF2313 [Ruminiclostridium sufflavum DSM 19573]
MITEGIDNAISSRIMFFNKYGFYYLPDFLKEFKEFRKLRNLSESEKFELLKIFKNIEGELNDNFINDSTEIGVESWERVMGITPKVYDTLNDRKFRILTRLNEKLPYKYREAERWLA